MNRIYLSPPHLDGRERELLLQAYESNWITTLGPHVDALELEISKKIGIGYAAALSSGTAALHLALLIRFSVASMTFLCRNSMLPAHHYYTRPFWVATARSQQEELR